MKSNHKTAEPHTSKQIVSHLRELLAEAERAASGTGEAEESALGHLRERFAETQEKIKEFYDSTREGVIDRAKKTDKMIRSHPYETLAIGVGVGALIGAITVALYRRRGE